MHLLVNYKWKYTIVTGKSYLLYFPWWIQKELYPDREHWSIELKIGIAFPKFNKFLKDKGEKSVTKENVRVFLIEMGWL